MKDHCRSAECSLLKINAAFLKGPLKCLGNIADSLTILSWRGQVDTYVSAMLHGLLRILTDRTIRTAVIQEFLSIGDDSFKFAYFYCSFSNDTSLDAQNILGSIVAQICTDSSPVYGELEQKYSEALKKPSPNPPRLDNDTLVSFVVQQAQVHRSIRLVVDGINECNDPEHLLLLLMKILESTQNVHLLISSIDEVHIHKIMNRMPNLLQLTASPSTIYDDVCLLVWHSLESKPRLKALPPNLQLEVSMKLRHGAHGM